LGAAERAFVGASRYSGGRVEGLRRFAFLLGVLPVLQAKKLSEGEAVSTAHEAPRWSRECLQELIYLAEFGFIPNNLNIGAN